MKSTFKLITFCLFAAAGCVPAFAQGTAFTYQGQLNNGANPVTGLYDFEFSLSNAPSAGSQVGSAVTQTAVGVTNGLFTTTLNFGAVFAGSPAWLAISVRSNGVGSYIGLNPLQELTPAPYAIFANAASNVSGTVPAAQLSGTVGSANLSGTYGNAVTLNNAGNSFSGAYAGNGAAVTNVNAATLNGLQAVNFWQLGGNNVAAGQFLGSTNNQPVVLRVGNLQALLLGTVTNDSANVVGGALVNMVDAGITGTVIAGGGTTNFMGKPSSNHISSSFSSIGGGGGNWIQAGSDHSLIGNGWNNIITSNSYQSVIAGGESNAVTNAYSAIGGGMGNVVSGGYATVAGGYVNIASGNGSFVGGGGNLGYAEGNMASGEDSAVVGGFNNIAAAPGAFVGGGGYDGQFYNGNTASGAASVVGGGQGNQATNSFATVAGGLENSATGPGAFVGGGGDEGGTYAGNTASGEDSVVGGGIENLASGMGAFVGSGGYDDEANNPGNTASGDNSVIGGGIANTASGTGDFVGGGGGAEGNNSQGNTASGVDSVIGGGMENQATNDYATVPGGADNIAGGQFSFAAGDNAQATNTGAFVWADSQNAAFNSTTTNQFSVRANGGVRFVTSGKGMTLDGQSVFAGSNGGGLTNLNAAQLTGTVPLAQLPNTVITNNETGVTLSNVTFNGTFNIPSNSFSGGALILHSDAIGNFFAGPNAGNPVPTAGGNNTAIGAGALGDNYGGNNTVVGFQALYNATTASYNTAVGGNALYRLGTTGASSGGTNNIALGYNAGLNFNANESSNIDIGNTGVAGENNTIRIGTPGIQTSTVIAGTINGNGGGLTNLNAAQLTGAVVPTSVLPGFQSSSNYSAVGGGQANVIALISDHSVIGGGWNNTIGSNDYEGTIAGGYYNTLYSSAAYAAIGGGESNLNSGSLATVAGGYANNASGPGAFIGGGGFDGVNYPGNAASGAASVVSGGEANNVSGAAATIGGGNNNTNLGFAATIAGGQNNTAGNFNQPAIGGGYGNVASNNYATVSGGDGNTASGQYATVGGGNNNSARGQWATIGGGLNNQANNNNCAVPGGANNIASGLSCFAAGLSAQAVSDHSFVWSDGSATTTSTLTNQFMLRAAGGVVIYSSSTNSGVSLAAGSGSWSSLSDRNAKNGFAPVTPQQLLAKVAALPLTQWSYKTEPGVRHIGPMAQDFYAAFNIGEDNKHISTVDEGGVALAAIQGLNQKLEQESTVKDAEIAALEKKAAQVDALESRLIALEAAMKHLTAQK